MTERDVIHQRLANQRLARSEFRKPSDVVAWLGAMQAQDYSGAKWAIALRGRGITDAAVEQAFTEGAILRTHLMRPTWHFVTPADIRSILSVTAPRVHAVSAFYYRKLELDGRVFARSRTAIERALEGGNHLTRAELRAVLHRVRIPADGLRLAYLMMHAELEQVICSGARRGKQFTYALLDERAPGARRLTHDQALAELTARYFSSHGPATLRDYAWWTGLTMRDAKTGVELVRPALVKETLGARTYWFAASRPAAPRPAPSTHLLPNYDEYLIAYKDRGPAVASPAVPPVAIRESDAFAHHLVIDGRLAGSWTRTLTKVSVAIEAALYERLTSEGRRSLAAAADDYRRFMDLPVTLSVR